MMDGLRSSTPNGKASDNLGKLSLNKRSVQIIAGDDSDVEKGKKTAGQLAASGTKGAAKLGGSAALGAAKAGAKGGLKVGLEAANEDDAAEAADREAKKLTAYGTQRGGATVAKSSGRFAGKAVKGGIVAAQKRAAAAKAAKSAASSGTSISRFAAAQARASAAAAQAIRSIVAAITTAATSTQAVVIISAVLAVVFAIIAIISFFAPAAAASCDMSSGGRIDPSKVPATAVSGYGHEQLVNAAYVIQAAQDKGLNVRDQTIGVMTAMGESSLRNIDYGDWETGGVTNPDGSRTTSIGLFQQQDGWGTREERLDPYIAAGKFFDAMISKVPDAERQTLAPTLVAHRTQVNADAYYYEPFWPAAQAVVGALTGLDIGGGGGMTLCQNIPGLPGEIGLDGWAKPGSGPVTDSFGPRDPISTPAGTTQSFHNGLDLDGGGCGGPVWAARDGKITRVFDGGRYGMIIEIDHGHGLITWYVHSYPDEIMVSAGQEVKAGQQIALVGSSGFSTGCHLHFEVHINGTAVDPYPILTAAGFTF